MTINSRTRKPKADSRPDSDQTSDPDRGPEQSPHFRTRSKGANVKPIDVKPIGKTLNKPYKFKDMYLAKNPDSNNTISFVGAGIILQSLISPSEAYAATENKNPATSDNIHALVKTQHIKTYEPSIEAYAERSKSAADSILPAARILQQEGGLNFRNSDFNVNIESAQPLVSTTSRGVYRDSGEFRPRNNNIDAKDAEGVVNLQQEEKHSISTPEQESGYKGGEAGEVKEHPMSITPEADLNIADHIPADNHFAPIPPQEIEVDAQEPEQMPELEVVREEEPIPVVEEAVVEAEVRLALEVGEEPASVAEEAVVEVKQLLAMEAGNNAEEVQPMLGVEEEAKEEIELESKQDFTSEEAVLFGQQHKQEEQMSKLFELPPITEQQRELNAKIKNGLQLLYKGESQLTGPEENVLMIFGKTGHAKSALNNTLSGHKQISEWNPEMRSYDITVLNPTESCEGAAAASGGGSKVGNDINRSETEVPHRNHVDATDKTPAYTIVDTPGFFDTRDFWRDGAIKRITEKWVNNSVNLKLILAISDDVISTKSDKTNSEFLNIITEFARRFENIETIKKSIALVVTKVENDVSAEWISGRIKKILATNELVKDGQDKGSDGWLARKVLEYTQDSVKVFHVPDSKVKGEMKRELLLEDFNSIEFCTTHRAKAPASQDDMAAASSSSFARPSIGSSNFFAGHDTTFLSKYATPAKDTLGQLQYNIGIFREIVLSFFKEQLDMNSALDSAIISHMPLLPTGAPNIFSKYYDSFVKELLPEDCHGATQDVKKLEINGEHKDENFLRLRQLERIKEVLQSQVPKSDSEKLAEALKILQNLCAEAEAKAEAKAKAEAAATSEFTDCPVASPGDERKDSGEASTKTQVALSETIGGYIHVLNLLLKFEESCSKWCGSGAHTNPLEGIVKECNTFVQDAFNGSINAIAITPREAYQYNKKTAEAKSKYYKEAIDWLKKSSDPSQEAIIKAQVFMHHAIASILKHEDPIGAAIEGEYKAIIGLNSNDKTAQQELGDLYLNRAKQNEKDAHWFDRRDQEQRAEDHYNKALAQYKQALKPLEEAGDREGVNFCFNCILKITPRDKDIIKMKGDYLVKSGLLYKACETYFNAGMSDADIQKKLDTHQPFIGVSSGLSISLLEHFSRASSPLDVTPARSSEPSPSPEPRGLNFLRVDDLTSMRSPDCSPSPERELGGDSGMASAAE